VKKSRLFLVAIYGIAFFLTFGLSKGFPSLLPPVFLYKSEGRRDPFIPLIEKKLPPEEEEVAQTPQVALNVEAKPKEVALESEYTLVGLVWDEEKAFATIRSQAGTWIVKEGDLLGEFLVLEIKGDQGEVTLEGAEKIVKLRIRE
jgi:Tfp pilus assembly protein PilP